jgi:hypothetical protein
MICLYAGYVLECTASGTSPLSAGEFEALVLSILENEDPG